VDQDTLRSLLKEAVRETVTEVLQMVMELDRTAFLQAHGAAGMAARAGERPWGPLTR